MDAKGAHPRASAGASHGVTQVLAGFDELTCTVTEVDGEVRQMTIAEIEKLLVAMKETATAAEVQLREDIQHNVNLILKRESGEIYRLSMSSLYFV